MFDLTKNLDDVCLQGMKLPHLCSFMLDTQYSQQSKNRKPCYLEMEGEHQKKHLNRVDDYTSEQQLSMGCEEHRYLMFIMSAEISQIRLGM